MVSILTAIGLGPGRAVTIASKYPSLSKLVKDTESDLLAVPGVGKGSVRKLTSVISKGRHKKSQFMKRYVLNNC